MGFVHPGPFSGEIRLIHRPPHSSSILKTPCFWILILHSGHRQVGGSFSNGVPAGIFCEGSPFAGSLI